MNLSAYNELAMSRIFGGPEREVNPPEPKKETSLLMARRNLRARLNAPEREYWEPVAETAYAALDGKGEEFDLMIAAHLRGDTYEAGRLFCHVLEQAITEVANTNIEELGVVE